MGNELFSDGALLTGVLLLGLLVVVFINDVLSGGTKKTSSAQGKGQAVKKVAGAKREAPKPVTQDRTEESKQDTALTETSEFSAREQAIEPQPAQETRAEVVESSESVFNLIKKGLGKTRASLSENVASLLLGEKTINDDLLEEIESQLLMADLGVDATAHIIDSLTERLQRKELADPETLYQALKEELYKLIEPCVAPLNTGEATPYVILMVGVNGAGKTTTIGKLAKRLQAQGNSVMLAAGDTFRAAAVEQLQEWGLRNEVPVVAQATGADSASVIYDALASARARNIDVLIADTAGRLQNKDNLMAELTKIKRVMGKLDESAPHEVMLVLDAGTGQNALSQAKLFNEAVGIGGITLTKLDGTAKGGVIFAVAKQMQLPIRFIGVGEKIDDLRPFDAKQFIDALFD